MNQAAAKTILQIGSWLWDEKPSIAGRHGFSLAVLFRWLFDVLEAIGSPLASLMWIMAQGQAALIHRRGKSGRSERQILTVMLSSSLLSCFSLRSYNSLALFSLSNVICVVYSLYVEVNIHCSHVYRSVCVHPLQLCLYNALRVWDNWVTDERRSLSGVHTFLFLTLMQLPKPKFYLSVIKVFLLPVFILQISHPHLSHLQQC